MAADDKKGKAAPKTESPSVDKTPAVTAPPKTESGETGATASAGYSRGEGQKPVTQAYKDNWNAIFGNKKTTATKKKR